MKIGYERVGGVGSLERERRGRKGSSVYVCNQHIISTVPSRFEMIMEDVSCCWLELLLLLVDDDDDVKSETITMALSEEEEHLDSDELCEEDDEGLSFYELRERKSVRGSETMKDTIIK